MVEAGPSSPCSSCGEASARRPSERPRLAKFLSYVEQSRARARSQSRSRQRCPLCEAGWGRESSPPNKPRDRRSSPEGRTRPKGRAARRCQSEAPSRARLREAVRQKLSAESSEGKQVYGYGQFTDELRFSPDVNNNKENETQKSSLPPVPSNIYGKERVCRARSRRRTVAALSSGPYSLQGAPPTEAPVGPRGRSKSRRARQNKDQGPYIARVQGPSSLSSYVAPCLPVLTPSTDSNVVTVTVNGANPHAPLLRSRSKSRPRLSSLQLSLGTATIWPDRHGIWLPL